jgi:hypothetical protein
MGVGEGLVREKGWQAMTGQKGMNEALCCRPNKNLLFEAAKTVSDFIFTLQASDNKSIFGVGEGLVREKGW